MPFSSPVPTTFNGRFLVFGTLQAFLKITNLGETVEMFVRMLTVHCDQNDSYEITINGFKVRKIRETRNVIFIKAKVGMFTKFST